MPASEPDFRLDGYRAVNDRAHQQFRDHIDIDRADFTVLAEHHSADSQHSYFILHNRAITWGIPGEPQLVALHLRRDGAARTFRFEHTRLPLAAMAQSWLIARGCPVQSLALPADMGSSAADDATRALESRLVSDGDHFAYINSYTADDPPAMQTTVLLKAIDDNVPLPFRVLLEEVDLDTWTHTLREGGYATFQEATSWWEKHWSGQKVPLPAVLSATPAKPDIPPPPARSTAQQPPGAPAIRRHLH